MAQHKFKTIAEEAFYQLREDIVRGRFVPGSKLALSVLRERYGKGASPLREALAQLVGIGLVVQDGQKGFRVAIASNADFLDLTRMRIFVECTALRLSIKNGDPDWEANVLAAHHRLQRESKNNSAHGDLNPDWEELHRKFHSALIRACNSTLLLNTHERLYNLSDRYRRLAFAMPSQPRNIDLEHRLINDAVLNRDTHLACSRIIEHLLLTARTVLESRLGADETERLINESKEQIGIALPYINIDQPSEPGKARR